MAHGIKIRGRLSDPRHIELDEPVHDLSGAVDIVIQERQEWPPSAQAHGFIGLCADLGRAPSAEEIDDARRDIWAPFPRDDVS